MKKLILILLFSAAMFSSPSYAESLGVVASSCGKFIQFDREENKSILLMYRTSFQAYISALDAVLDKHKARGLTVDSLYYAVLNICKDKPLQRIDESLLQLYGEIVEDKNP